METIKANAWTLQAGDKIATGIFGDCTVEYVRDDETKGYTRVFYKRDTDFIHSFTTRHNNPFKIFPRQESE